MQCCNVAYVEKLLDWEVAWNGVVGVAGTGGLVRARRDAVTLAVRSSGLRFRVLGLGQLRDLHQVVPGLGDHVEPGIGAALGQNQVATLQQQ